VIPYGHDHPDTDLWEDSDGTISHIATPRCCTDLATHVHHLINDQRDGHHLYPVGSPGWWAADQAQQRASLLMLALPHIDFP
jgi:hypothetical protein